VAKDGNGEKVRERERNGDFKRYKYKLFRTLESPAISTTPTAQFVGTTHLLSVLPTCVIAVLFFSRFSVFSSFSSGDGFSLRACLSTIATGGRVVDDGWSGEVNRILGVLCLGLEGGIRDGVDLSEIVLFWISFKLRRLPLKISEIH
jgi:hypothetical protein